MPGNIQHTQPPGKPPDGSTLLDRLRADCIKAGVAGREELRPSARGWRRGFA